MSKGCDARSKVHIDVSLALLVLVQELVKFTVGHTFHFHVVVKGVGFLLAKFLSKIPIKWGDSHDMIS